MSRNLPSYHQLSDDSDSESISTRSSMGMTDVRGKRVRIELPKKKKKKYSTGSSQKWWKKYVPYLLFAAVVIFVFAPVSQTLITEKTGLTGNSLLIFTATLLVGGAMALREFSAK